MLPCNYSVGENFGAQNQMFYLEWWLGIQARDLCEASVLIFLCGAFPSVQTF